MKNVTRKGVFETNSSSTHSFSIAATGVLSDTLPVYDGVCTIETSEFGRGYDEFTDATTKASYLATYLIDVIRWADSEVRTAYEKLLIEAVKNRTGAERVRLLHRDGYIDHESHSVANQIFKDGIEAIERFIFNPDSVLIIDFNG
jgi:hypothetical protein